MPPHLHLVLMCLLLLPLAGFGQEDKVIIAGVVVDADSLQRLPSVHLRVRHSSLGGVTAEDGSFRFSVSPTDTLVFSSVGYQPYTLVPADSSASRLQKLVIKMQPLVTVLDEVKIKDYRDISRYLQPKIDSTIDMRRSVGKPVFEEQEVRKRESVGMVGGPDGARLEGGLTALANQFSSEYQQKKKLKELLEEEEAANRKKSLQKRALERFEQMLLSASRLGEADLKIFTDRYLPEPYLVMQMSDYQLMAYIQSRLKKYKAEDKKLQELLEKGKFEGDERQSVKPPTIK